ncbi:MAG: aldehyde dehydrogenase family protein [Peptococcaceae bacterium]|jgi:acyl-CoA reductase-like NAD-dependent aldehyde dehydrogenase|nr:aldehyde dehydrogenase family protein [Peptococcaceae bacterium]
MYNKKMWIGGEFVAAVSGKTFATYNVTTNEELGRAPLADQADVDKAVAAARQAFPAWSEKTPAERAVVSRKIAAAMREAMDELAQLDTLEHGLPGGPAKGVGMAATGLFDTAADYARAVFGDAISSSLKHATYTLERVPIGVCALITPWNMPLFLMAAKVALAITSGNTCILKPPSINSITALRFAEAMATVKELPPGVVNVITGPGSSIGNILAAHEGIDCVGFTGSTETGSSIMAAAAPTLKKLVMELGGKNPAIILPDANLDRAVEVLSHHQFFNCGQACGSPGRYYIHESIFDQFLEKYLEHAHHFVLGDPQDPKTVVGPMVSKEHMNKVLSYIASGKQEGATLKLGGERLLTPPYDQGNFVLPTVFTDVTPAMKIYREEIFGPVAVMLKFSAEEDVLQLANDNTYGLTASIWTRNIAKALKMGRKLTVGTFSVNAHNLIAPEVPWGGVRRSGIGKEGGLSGFLEFTEQKMITIDLTE